MWVATGKAFSFVLFFVAERYFYPYSKVQYISFLWAYIIYILRISQKLMFLGREFCPTFDILCCLRGTHVVLESSILVKQRGGDVCLWPKAGYIKWNTMRNAYKWLSFLGKDKCLNFTQKLGFQHHLNTSLDISKCQKWNKILYR